MLAGCLSAVLRKLTLCTVRSVASAPEPWRSRHGSTHRAEERLGRLESRHAIHEVLMRYCRAIDRLDVPLLRSCYHQGSWDDHGHYKGDGHEFAEFIVRSLAERAHHTTHAVANVLIEMDAVDADLARAESYALAHLRRTDPLGVEWLDLFSGRYPDCFERRDGTWRITERVVVHDWSASTVLDPATAFPLPMDGFTQGRRDEQDAVYLPGPRSGAAQSG